MTISVKASGLAALLVLWAGVQAREQASASSRIREVVLLEHSESGGHVQSRKHLRETLSRLAEIHRFKLVVEPNPASLTDARLASAQVLVLSNGDGDVVPAGASREAVENFVKRDGRGLIVVHAATAFLKDWTFLKEGVVQPYHRHLPAGTWGTVFADTAPGHGLAHPEARMVFEGLPTRVALPEEYYGFKESPRSAPGVTVLLSLDPASIPGGRLGQDLALVWSRKTGKGRVLTHTLGHGKSFFTGADSFGQRFLWNGMRYAAGDFVECLAQTAKNEEGKLRGPACEEGGVVGLTGSNVVRVTDVRVRGRTLHVRLADERDYKLEILRMDGRSVLEVKLRGPLPDYRVTGLENGGYLVRIRSGVFSLSRTFAIQ